MTDDNISAKMMHAMMQDTEFQVPKISKNDQIDYLMRYIDTVTVKDRISLCRVIASAEGDKKIRDHNQGKVVDLDTLSDNTIYHMYELLSYKRDQK